MKRDPMQRISRWLAVAFLLAQFGAEIHLYSHALAGPSDRMGPAKTCATCLASSQLQNAVAPPTAEVPAYAIAWATFVPVAAALASRSAPEPAYRSRAPPVLA